ncbi:MAG TPA: hypothetical protein VLB46_13305 [Pyrinomonadaceae bacterium]|nr:hypothetical protein [Pyrinomonadaceae bacterium]
MNCERFESDEEMLTRGLQSLAAEMEALEAPPEVEAKLLEAFRARQVVVPFPRRQSSSRYWLAAIAAMLLIAISVVVFRWGSRPANDQREAVRREEPQPQPTANNKSNEQLVKDVEKPADVNSLPHRPKPKRVYPVSSRRPDSAQVANHVTKEIATDFIPLSYMSAASLQDGGQIVRVQLPRSALANFGLPVNMDRYNEKVKADVLVGVDGMARAIRFIQ